MAKSAGKAYDAIRARILDGNFPPKSHLREKDLAEVIGVSRTPVREALRKLAADGYVQFIPNRGAFVAEWTETSLSALIDVRAELAAMAGRLAANQIRREDLAELARLNRAMIELAERRRERLSDRGLAAEPPLSTTSCFRRQAIHGCCH